MLKLWIMPYSLNKIFELKLLKRPNGKPYKSINSIQAILRARKFTKKPTPHGKSYMLTDQDIEKLQNLINKNKGIWNTPTTTKSNTSGSSVAKANQQET